MHSKIQLTYTARSLVNTKVDQLEKSIKAMDESIELIKKLGGGGGNETSGIVDMINDLKLQLNSDIEKTIDDKISALNDRFEKIESIEA